MPRYINDSCIKCGSCADTCQLEAISVGDNKYEIDPNACIDCGACEDVCTVDAIKLGIP